MKCIALGCSILAIGCGVARSQEPGREGYVDSNGVKLHFVTTGQGPLIVLLHGFPDFWFSWRGQMPALAAERQVVAMDLRGFNLSDKPTGVAEYSMEKLIGDVAAVIRHFKRERAIVVGHDWGGAIAWSFAMQRPQMTERLIILNLPHPQGIVRELAGNPEQQRNSQYARNFQQPNAADLVKPAMLVAWIKDAEVRAKYLQALERSSMEGMLNYYKANYPRAPYKVDGAMPKVQCPVLIFHGLQDRYLLPGALNDTWNWVDKDLTIVTVPNAGHFVHHDAPGFVADTMVTWLRQPRR